LNRPRTVAELARLSSWLRDEVWPLWLEHGVDWKRRGFHEHLGHESLACTADFRRLRVAARQVYSFSEAALCGVPRAREAVQLGVEFLVAARQDDGGHPWRFDLSGNPTDQTRDLYDHAFVILAFASAARVFDKDIFRSQASRTAHYLRTVLRHPTAGFLESVPDSRPRRQNPHMHLLEAAIAAFEVFQDSEWLELSQQLMALFRDRFFRPGPGCIAEFLDDDLNPLLKDGRFQVEPGHHFEWAWLLRRYAAMVQRQNLPQDPRVAAVCAATLASAYRWGVALPANLVVDEIDSTGQVTQSTFRMWPQSERVKCEARRPAAEDAVGAAGIASLWQMIEGAPRGLWHERLDQNRRAMPMPSPASTVYHLTCAAAQSVNPDG
jgi:mannose/cellobiose epimerase-like protein (N-acyl-D-glucosamine 2-epimerase family)